MTLKFKHGLKKLSSSFLCFFFICTEISWEQNWHRGDLYHNDERRLTALGGELDMLGVRGVKHPRGNLTRGNPSAPPARPPCPGWRTAARYPSWSGRSWASGTARILSQASVSCPQPPPPGPPLSSLTRMARARMAPLSWRPRPLLNWLQSWPPRSPRPLIRRMLPGAPRPRGSPAHPLGLTRSPSLGCRFQKLRPVCSWWRSLSPPPWTNYPHCSSHKNPSDSDYVSSSHATHYVQVFNWERWNIIFVSVRLIENLIAEKRFLPSQLFFLGRFLGI